MSTENIIATLDTKWGEMIDAHDLDGVVDLYDPEGSFLIPGQPALDGHIAIRAAWQHLFGLPEFKLTLGRPSVTATGADDFAIDRGSYELSFRGPDGLSVEQGKYLVVWRKNADNMWKIFADMFNSNG